MPELLGAEQDGPSTIKVEFSEPVDPDTVDASNFEVDGGTYFIDNTSVEVEGNVVSFDLYTTIPEGEHTVTVKGVKDFAGYSVITSDTTFVASVDDAAPTVTKVVKATPEQVVVEFSEDISIEDGTLSNFYHTNSGNAASHVEVINGNQLKLSFADSNLPKGTAYLYIKKEVLADNWNNENEAIELVVSVEVDNTKPEVSKVESTDDQTVVLTFSEDIATGAETEANYTVLDATGEEVETTFTANLDSDEVTLNFDEALPGSVYTVVVENLEDAAGNEINKVSKSFSVTDTTPPEVSDIDTDTDTDTVVDGYLYASKQIVKIAFNEAMNSDDLLDLDNYQYVNGKYLSSYDDVTATITDNGKAVLLDFSDEDTVTLSDGDDIIVGKVRDAAGNATESFATEVNLVNQDDAGISISEVALTGKKTLKVTLADALSSFEANDFSLEDTDGAAVGTASVKFENVDGKGVITYTLTNEVDTAPADIFVVTADSDIGSKNAYGVAVAEGETSDAAADKIAPEFTAEFTDADTIELTFSEDVDSTTLSIHSFAVSGNTVTAYSFTDGIAPTADTVTLDLKTAVNDGTEVTVTQELNFEDAEGNVASDLSVDATYTAPVN